MERGMVDDGIYALNARQLGLIQLAPLDSETNYGVSMLLKAVK